MGWGYWSYPWVPSVDLFKFLDPRRMTNVCNRWAINHTDDLQAAWFNGEGFETWENGECLPDQRVSLLGSEF